MVPHRKAKLFHLLILSYRLVNLVVAYLLPLSLSHAYLIRIIIGICRHSYL